MGNENEVKTLKNNDNSINKKSEEEIRKGIEYLLKQVAKSKPFTEKQRNELEKYAKEALAFDEVIEKIDISGEKFKVIFTDGEEQLVYDNGEFFIISTIDSKKVKEKKKRSEARNIYIEYYIKYQLNPIIEQKRINGNIRIISGKDISKEIKDIKKSKNEKDGNQKEEIKTEINKEKKIKENLKEEIFRNSNNIVKKNMDDSERLR